MTIREPKAVPAIEYATIEATDPAAAEAFYDAAFDVGSVLRVDGSDAPIERALYRRRSLAKLAGVPDDGTESDRVRVVSDAGLFVAPTTSRGNHLSTPEE